MSAPSVTIAKPGRVVFSGDSMLLIGWSFAGIEEGDKFSSHQAMMAVIHYLLAHQDSEAAPVSPAAEQAAGDEAQLLIQMAARR